MTTLLIQRLISLPFLVLGGWCLFFPGMVEELTLTPAYQHNSETSRLLIACFGAQAVLSGLFAAFSRFTRMTFAVYAAALLPFFWFNYWFVFVVPMFNAWLALDFVSNAAMLGLCILGWRVAAPLPAGEPIGKPADANGCWWARQDSNSKDGRRRAHQTARQQRR